MGQGTVVGEQEEPLAVAIETADRIHSGNGHIILERRSSCGVGELAEHVKWLEKSEIARRLPPGHDQLPSGVLTRNSRTLKTHEPNRAKATPAPIRVSKHVVALGIFSRSIAQSLTRKPSQ